MIVALIDNGSLQQAAQLNLRAVAAALSTRTGVNVHAVSWKHSDRTPHSQLPALRSQPIWTLAPFIRAQLAAGENEFLFVPFFISAQGAIRSALRSDLEKLQQQLGGFSFAFTAGLAASGALGRIVAARVRQTIAIRGLRSPPVIVVDHGGPSPASAALRDSIAREIGASASASMEGVHPPLLADELRKSAYAGRDVVIALLFLAPGRHAGARGDVARICHASHVRCHLTALVGDHPAVVDTLAAALLAQLHPMEAGNDVS
jgi:sirohydrochlorin ferrochelatase